MAPGALIVPVLVDARPMQGISRGKLAFRIKIEPALAAFFERSRVPRQPERLEAAAAEVDEILLQRVDAESIFYFEIAGPAVRSFGVNEEAIVLFRENGSHAVLLESRAVEAAERRFFARLLHRSGVMGGAPGGVLLRVTLRAGGGTDKSGRRGRRVSLLKRMTLW